MCWFGAIYRFWREKVNGGNFKRCQRIRRSGRYGPSISKTGLARIKSQWVPFLSGVETMEQKVDGVAPSREAISLLGRTPDCCHLPGLTLSGQSILYIIHGPATQRKADRRKVLGHCGEKGRGESDGRFNQLLLGRNPVRGRPKGRKSKALPSKDKSRVIKVERNGNQGR